MSKGLRVIKSTECNLESEQTRNSLRDSQPGHKAGRTSYCLSSIRTGAPFNKRMGDLARRSLALFALDRRPILDEV